MSSLETVFPVSSLYESTFSVDARTLHNWLGVETRFNDWFTRRVEEFGFTQDVDFSVLKNEYAGMTRKDSPKKFLLTMSMAKELGMMERSEKGKQVRRYFLACEQIAFFEYPKLSAELARKEEVILKLQSGKKRRTGEGYVLVPHEEPCFEGHIPKTTYERVPSSEISDEQRKEFLTAHNARIVAGIFKTTIQEVGMKAAFEAFYNSFKNFLPN